MIKNNKLRTVRRTNQYGLGSLLKAGFNSYFGKGNSANLGKDLMGAGLGLVSQFGDGLSGLAAQKQAKEQQAQQEGYDNYKQQVADYNNYQKQQMANKQDFINTSESLLANQQQQAAQEKINRQQGQLNILAPAENNQYLAGGLIAAGVGAASSLLNGVGALIGNGYESGVGNALNSIPVVGGFLGGITNSLFGTKENKALHAQVNQDTAYLNNFQSDANSFDSVTGPRAVGFNTDVYSGGLFNKGKARRKNEALRNEMLAAETRAYNQVDNNIDNLKTQQSDMLEATYAAFGGPLGHPYMYGFGGNVNTHGGDFPTGLTHINAGGTHEESPYQGVPMGQDAEGTPNLVEENETIYNDYVFSERLKVPTIDKPMNGKKYQQWEKVLRKYKNKSYSDAAKKAEKDSGVDERPNDPIARRGFESVLEILAQSQEQVRDIENNPDQAEQIASMSPEEYANYKAEQEQQQAAQQQAMMEQMQAQQAQQMSPEQQAMMQQQAMQQQQMSSEEQAMAQQQMMAQQGAQPQMACGGHLHAEGGQLSPEEQAATEQQEVPPTEEIPADQELSTPSGTEEAPSAEISQFNAGTPADEMSTKELNETIDEIYQYAKDNKDKDLLQRARKAKRGTREDKEAFVEDAREDIQMAMEEQQQQQQVQEEQQAQEQAAIEAQQQAQMQQAQADPGQELDAQENIPQENSFALGGEMSLNDPEGGQSSTEGKVFAGPKIAPAKKYEGVNASNYRDFLKYLSQNNLSIKDFIKYYEGLSRGNKWSRKKYTQDLATKWIEGINKANQSKVAENYLSNLSYPQLQALAESLNVDTSNIKQDTNREQSYRDAILKHSPDYAKYNEILNTGSTLTFRDKNYRPTWKTTKGTTRQKVDSKFFTGDNAQKDLDAYYESRLADYLESSDAEKWKPSEEEKRKGQKVASKFHLTGEQARGFNKYLEETSGDNAEKDKELAKLFRASHTDGIDWNGDWEYKNKFTPDGTVQENKEYRDYYSSPANGGAETNAGKLDSQWGRLHSPKLNLLYETPDIKERTAYYVDGQEIDDSNFIDENGKWVNPSWTAKADTDLTNDDGSVVHRYNLTRSALPEVDDTMTPTNTLGGDTDESVPYPLANNAIFGLGIGAQLGTTLFNALTPIDYSNADAIEAAANNITYKPVGFTPLGHRLTYRPVDRNYEGNKLQAQMGAERRSIENLANQNRATATANLFNSDYNLVSQLGDLDYKAELANRQHEAQVAGHDTDIDKFNSEGMLKADMANQDAAMKSQMQRIAGIEKAYAMRQALEDAKGASVSAGLSGTVNNIFNLWKQDQANKWVKYGVKTGTFGSASV